MPFPSPPPFLVPAWRWRGFLCCHVLAGLLLASWLWPPARTAWELFDDRLFHALNTPLSENPRWAFLWALTSLRPMDLATALLMLALLIGKRWIFPAAYLRQALFAFLALLALLVAMRAGFTAWVDWIGWQRNSPSRVMLAAVHLSELFPDWHWQIKDGSSHSFPGDHAAVLFVWALFLSLFARGARLVAVWIVCFAAMLPRLVAGAHWASDDFVGGLFLALLAQAWGCYTPYAAHLAAWTEKRTRPFFGRLARLPGLRRLAVVREE